MKGLLFSFTAFLLLLTSSINAQAQNWTDVATLAPRASVPVSTQSCSYRIALSYADSAGTHSYYFPISQIQTTVSPVRPRPPSSVTSQTLKANLHYEEARSFMLAGILSNHPITSSYLTSFYSNMGVGNIRLNIVSGVLEKIELSLQNSTSTRSLLFSSAALFKLQKAC